MRFFGLALLMTTIPTLAHAAEGSGGLPQFKTEWFPSQLFWLAITFILLFAYFSGYALPRLTQTIEGRAKKIQNDLQTAEEMTKKAYAIRDAYERDMNKARARATDVMRQVDAQLKEKASDLAFSHRTTYAREVARTEDEITAITAKLGADIESMAADFAARIAADITGGAADPDLAKSIIRSTPKQKAA